MLREELFSNENYNLWILLRQVDQAIYRAREKELVRRNITAEQAEALFCIKVIGDNVTPTKLSRCIIKQPHSTATLINRMAEKGLVSKTKDLPQKNMARIKLTDKGEEAFNKARESVSITSIIARLSQSERRQLRNILEKLRDAAFNELGLEDLPLGPPPLGKIIPGAGRAKQTSSDFR